MSLKDFLAKQKLVRPNDVDKLLALPPSVIRVKPHIEKRRIKPFVGRNCLLAARVRMFAVVLSIGAGSMFLVSLDSVVDNLIPVAREFLIKTYGSEAAADYAWSWVVSSRVYGLAFGCFFAFLLSNWQSRKWPLIISFVMNLAGGGLSILITVPICGIQIACFGRFLSGIGSGLAHVIGAAMLAEIPPIRLRGTVLASLTVWACLGELFGMFLSLDTVLGTRESWHLALGVPVLIIPVALIFLMAAPDSPRALVIAGRDEEAFQSLQFYQKPADWIASLKDIKTELMSAHHAKENGVKVPLLHGRTSRGSRLSSGKFIRPLLLGTFVLTFAHLDDWLWISYSTQAFENAGVPTSQAQHASLWMSFPQALVSIALLFCFDGLPRRQLLIVPTMASICCAVLAISALVRRNSNPMISAESLPYLAALDLCAAAVASESAYSVVPELFPQRDRVMGTALIGIVQNIFGGFLTTIALPLMNRHGTEYVLIPFVVLNVVYIVVIINLLPETCGKTFHEISENFSDQLPALLTSPFECLKGYPLLLVMFIRKTFIHTVAMLQKR